MATSINHANDHSNMIMNGADVYAEITKLTALCISQAQHEEIFWDELRKRGSHLELGARLAVHG